MLIQEIEDSLTSIHYRFLDKVNGVNPLLANKKSNTNKWSVVEIIDHVTIVEGMVNAALEKYAKRLGSKKLSESPDVQISEQLLKISYKAIMSLDAFPNSEPNNGLVFADALNKLKDVRIKTMEKLVIGKQANLESIVLPHKYFGPLNYYDWLYFVAKHEELHLQHLNNNLAAILI